MLLGKRVEPAVADQVVTELIELGYLDDARYAQRFAEDRRRLDAWGSDRIARRLRELGVDREAIEAAVAAQDPEEELAAALELLRRRCPAAAHHARRARPRARHPRSAAATRPSSRSTPCAGTPASRPSQIRGAERAPAPRFAWAASAVLRSGTATDQARRPENTSKQTLSARDQAASRDGRPNYDPEAPVSRPFPPTKTKLAAI